MKHPYDSEGMACDTYGHQGLNHPGLGWFIATLVMLFAGLSPTPTSFAATFFVSPNNTSSPPLASPEEPVFVRLHSTLALARPGDIVIDQSRALVQASLKISLHVQNPAKGSTLLPYGQPVTIYVSAEGPGSSIIIDFGDGTSETYARAINNFSFFTRHTWSNSFGNVRITATVHAPGSTPSSATTSAEFTVVDSLDFAQNRHDFVETMGTIQIPVVRRGLLEGTAAVNYQAFADPISRLGLASAFQDLIPIAGTLLFAPGQRTNFISIELLDDTLIEGPELFYMRLSDPAGAASPGSVSYLTIFIHDVPFELSANPVSPPGLLPVTSQGPLPTAAFLESSEPMNVYLRPLPGLSALVNLRTVDGSALAGADFSAINTNIYLLPDTTNVLIQIPQLNDALSEINPEFFRLVATASGGVQLDNEFPMEILIRDNDTGFRLPSDYVGIVETGETLTVTVERGSDLGNEVSVQFAASSGSAEAGRDFIAQSGTLTFGPNDTQKTISIQILDDGEFETDETFLIQLSQPSPGTALGSFADLLYATIRSDESVVSFQQTNIFSREGWSTLQVQVARIGGIDTESSVKIATRDGTARAGTDYTAVSGTLIFPKGVTAQYFLVPLVNDELLESLEHFDIVLSDPSKNSTLGTAIATVQIWDDDLKYSISFAQPTFEVNELDGFALIQLTRSLPAAGTVQAFLTFASPSATLYQDYQVGFGSVEWHGQDTEAFVHISIIEDSRQEGDETITLGLRDFVAQNGTPVTLGVIPTATLVIKDAGTAVEFDRGQALAFAESATNVVLTVRRRGNPQSAFTVPFWFEPINAQPGIDYTAAAGELSFESGQSTRQISFQLHDDYLVDGAKSFRVALGTPSNTSVRLTSNSDVVCTIQDNELPTLFDPKFRPHVDSAKVLTAAGYQPDGKILVSGNLRVAGQPIAQRLARLNPDGSLDPSFQPSTDPALFPSGQHGQFVTVLANGKILLTSQHSTTNSHPSDFLPDFLRINRLTPDGKLDDTFVQTNILTRPLNSNYPGQWISDMIEVSDGTLYVAGIFSTVNGARRHGLARFNANGSFDPTFELSSGALGPPDDNNLALKSEAIDSLAIQSDGRLIIGGRFVEVGGSSQAGVARLNPDGTLDVSFRPPDIFRARTERQPRPIPASVSKVCVQSDGKILVAGGFRTINGASPSGLVRLHADGSMDDSFSFQNSGSGGVNHLAHAVDGSIWIGGMFSQVQGFQRNGMARLKGDGSLDLSFIPTPNSTINRLWLLPDGSPMVSGPFSDAVTGSSGWTIARILPRGQPQVAEFAAERRVELGESATHWTARLRRTGHTTDPLSVTLITAQGTATAGQDYAAVTHVVNFAPGEVYKDTTGAILDDGLVEPTETFDLVLTTHNLPDNASIGWHDRVTLRIRDNETRTTIDRRFQPQLDGELRYAVAMQPDGKVLAATFKDHPSTNVQSVRIQRFLSDGSLDPTFSAQLSSAPDSCCPSVRFINPAPDGKLFVSGDFHNTHGNFQRIVRLLPDGRRDLSFDASAALEGGTITAAAVQPDGKPVVVNNNFELFRLNLDGSEDVTFAPPLDFDNAIRDIWPLADGRWMITGDFSNSNSDGFDLPWGVARLGRDGALDRTYRLPSEILWNGMPLNIQSPPLGVLGDGSVVLATAASDDTSGAGFLQIIKLLPDASIGTVLTPDQLGATLWPERASMMPLPDGGALIRGREFDPQIGDTDWHRMVHLEADGTMDESFDSFQFWPESEARIFFFRFIEGNAAEGFAVIPSRGLVRPEGFFDKRRLLLLRTGPTPRTVVGFAAAPATVSESQSSLNVKVMRFGDTSREESVTIEPADSRGRNGIDYRLTSTALTFRPLQTETDASLAILDNASADGARTAILRLSSPTPGVTLEGELVSIRIIDDESEGYLDSSFQFNGDFRLIWGLPYTERLMLLPDGRILAFGHFPFELRRDCNSSARILANGQLDPTLRPDECIDWKISLLSSGRSLVYVDGLLTRLLANGQVDPSFQRHRGDGIIAAAEQADGRLLLGGWFNGFIGTSFSKLVRLNVDGSIDTSFQPRLYGATPDRFVDGTMATIAIQADGKIITGGQLRADGRTDWIHLARLESDGRIDPSFTKWTGPTSDPARGYIHRILPIVDGELLVLGDHHLIDANYFRRIAVVGADGQVGRLLDWGEGPWVKNQWENRASEIYEMIILPDGDLLLGGNFTHFDGVRASGIVKLNLNPSPVAALRFTAVALLGTSIRFTLEVTSGSRYALESSIDLVTWNSVASITAAAATIELSDNTFSQDAPRRFYRIKKLD